MEPPLETIVTVCDDVSDLQLTPPASSRVSMGAAPLQDTRTGLHEWPPDDSDPEQQQLHARPLLETVLGALKTEAWSSHHRRLPPRRTARRRQAGTHGAMGLREQGQRKNEAPAQPTVPPDPVKPAEAGEPAEAEEPEEPAEAFGPPTWQDAISGVLRAEAVASAGRRLPPRKPRQRTTRKASESADSFGEDKLLEKGADGMALPPQLSLRQLLWVALRSELVPRRRPRGRGGRRAAAQQAAVQPVAAQPAPTTTTTTARLVTTTATVSSRNSAMPTWAPLLTTQWQDPVSQLSALGSSGSDA